MKALLIIPTYNERNNLGKALEGALRHDDFHALVIDDASPDRTAEVAHEFEKKTGRVFVIERIGKLGLKTAYTTGFKWGMERDYEYFIEMDADGSHDPEVLPFFIEEIKKGYDMVIGSRYTGGTISVIGWSFKRLMLSKFGNLYSSTLLGLSLTDSTSGFRCYSRKALERINLDGVRSSGYAFQIEMAYRIKRAGLRIGEIPIIFYERTYGKSKMSGGIIKEAIILPWRLRLDEIKKNFGSSTQKSK